MSARYRNYCIEQRYNDTGFYYVILYNGHKVWMSETINKFDKLVDAKRVFVDYVFGQGKI